VARDDNDVLFISGIVAGWVPKAKAQLRYIKDSLKRVLVSNRALASPFAQVEDPKIRSWLIEELGANSLIAKNRLTPRYFHDLDNEPLARWPAATRCSGFGSLFWNPYINSLDLTAQTKKRVYNHFHNICFPLYFAECHEGTWEELCTMYPHSSSRTLVTFALSLCAGKDALPFAFYSSLMKSVKDNVKEYALNSDGSAAQILGKKKAKALASMKHFHESDSSSSGDIDSSSAERIVAELDQKAFKRGRTGSGARKRLRWTPEEDMLLARMYLKYMDQNLPFVSVSAYFEDRSNNDCNNRLKAISRSNKLENYSHKQICNFVLNHRN
jgi:hypothetical protein